MGERRGIAQKMVGDPHCYAKLHIRWCEGEEKRERETCHSRLGRKR